MNMYEYTRIYDIRDETFSSLEDQCTEMGKAGWRVISISSGDRYRAATLEREVLTNAALDPISKGKKK